MRAGVDHVLAQVVAADIHQLHRVERAASEMRSRARVRRDAVKGEVRAHDGDAPLRANLVDRRRVPCIGKVNAVEIPGARDELLGARALLGGAAEEDHRAVLLLPLEVVLQRDGPRRNSPVRAGCGRSRVPHRRV